MRKAAAIGVFLICLLVATVMSAATTCVNPMNHGATPNDSTDDHAAFTSAFNAAYTAGAEVCIPAGLWKLSATLHVKGGLGPDQGLRVVGDDWRRVRFQPMGAGITMFKMEVYSRLENITIEGDGSEQSKGIQFIASGAEVANVFIKNCGFGFYLYKDLSGGNSLYNTVREATIASCRYGVYIHTHSDLGELNWINNNRFYNVKIAAAGIDAVYINGGDGNIFIGGAFEDAGSVGIRIIDGQSNAFYGNWIEDNVQGNLFLRPDVRVSGNVIHGPGLDDFGTAVATTGSLTNTTLTVASATGIIKGKSISIAGAGTGGAPLLTNVVDVNGNTITVADAGSVGSGAVVRAPAPSANTTNLIVADRHAYVLGTAHISRMRLGGDEPHPEFYNHIHGGYRAFKGSWGDYRVDLASDTITGYKILHLGSAQLFNLTAPNGDLILKGALTLGRATQPAPLGSISFGTTTAATVGAAGTASPLPSNPFGYLVINIGGTNYKVPYYRE